MTESARDSIKPIAFMVMPFGVKRPDREEGERIPDLIDFDQLWTDVFMPVLSERYTPVRADQDFGPLIIVELIERLTAADLVVADMTLQNANVYWEIGIRQAAKPSGCVLVAADWAKPAFDLDQVRQLRYPLPESPLSKEASEAARTAIASGLHGYVTSKSPVFAAVPDFPDADPTLLPSFEDYAKKMNQFHKQVTLITRDDGDKAQATRDLVAEYRPEALQSKAVVWQILTLVRDHLGWEELLEYVSQLPEPLQADPDIQEQRFLAIGKTGRSMEAVIEMEALIHELGETSERCGILGGRYKELWRIAEVGSPASKGHLRNAIASYETGMYTDLNAYYCASNLPRLYRSLDPEDDELQAKADRATAITLAACDRARRLDREDEWLKPTLLATAFEGGQLQTARQLVREIQDGDWTDWKLETVVKDLRTSVTHHQPELQAQLNSELDKLELLIAS